MGSTAVIVRDGTPDDSLGLAVLRFRDAGRDPARAQPAVIDLALALERWMREHEQTSFCVLAAAADEIVGMAWLVVVDRVPVITDHNRRSGEIQSVFVLPEYRRQNIGRAMIERLGVTAEQLGLSRVSLHSSGSAIPFYATVGFTTSDRLLQRSAGK